MPRIVLSLIPSAFFVAVAWMYVFRIGFTNDHFDRISRGRQILVTGEVPFRDFFDPGYFLAAYSSAAVQALFGHNLLGEALLAGGAIAAGFTIALLLARRLAGSWGVALPAAIAGAATLPRLYNYDKVLFLPLALLAAWSYAASPSRRRLAAMGLVIALAAMYRVDSGAYTGAAAIVAIVITHARAPRRVIAATAGLVAAVLVSLAPALLFVETHGGVADALRQVAEYAAREGRRTEIFDLPRIRIDTEAPWLVTGAPINVRWAEPLPESRRAALERTYSLLRGQHDSGRTWTYRLTDVSEANVAALVADPAVEDTAGLQRVGDGVMRATSQTQLLPGVATVQNAAAWLGYTVFALPVVAALGAATAAGRGVRAELLTTAALALVANAFLLRDPIEARIGDVAAPAIPMAAWVAAKAFERRGAGLRVATMLLVAALLVVGCAAIWVLSGSTLVRAQDDDRLATLRESPPSDALLSSSRTAGLIRYIRACTADTDRVLATWFAPELYYYADRGFAGGMIVFFGGHWSTRQPEIVNRLLRQPVPLAVLEQESYAEFAAVYPLVDEYLRTVYTPAGQHSFGDSQGSYRVLIRQGVTPAGMDVATGLPCVR